MDEKVEIEELRKKLALEEEAKNKQREEEQAKMSQAQRLLIE